MQMRRGCWTLGLAGLLGLAGGCSDRSTAPANKPNPAPAPVTQPAATQPSAQDGSAAATRPSNTAGAVAQPGDPGLIAVNPAGAKPGVDQPDVAKPTDPKN